MILLASASPRRRELLTQIGIAHRVLPAHIDESLHPDERPESYVRRLALEKGRAVQAQHPGETVLAADTTVVLDGQILNKPVDIADAERMLRALADRIHHVHTGIAVLNATASISHVEVTAVTFTAIPEAELNGYLATGDSLDKAGGYGIQGYAARWVSRIDGDFFNVVGLPVASVVRLLRETEQEFQWQPPKYPNVRG